MTPIIAEDVQAILGQLEGRLDPLRGSTILITGASGFLCSYFVEVLAELNRRERGTACRILAVDNLRSGRHQRLAHLGAQDGVVFLEHDVTQELVLREPVDWIIHGASIASPPVGRRYPLETIDVNVTGTRRFLELARSHSVRGMLYLSTSEAYGDPDPANVPTAEEYRGSVSCTGARACYDESKRLAETLCLTYFRLFGVPVTTVQPFTVYGPGQPLDDGRIIPDLMAAAVNGRPITLFSDGRATRAFCYISDGVCVSMLQVLLDTEHGNVYNVYNVQGRDCRSRVAGRAASLARHHSRASREQRSRLCNQQPAAALPRRAQPAQSIRLATARVPERGSHPHAPVVRDPRDGDLGSGRV